MRQVNILIDASPLGDDKVFRQVKKELDPQGKGYHLDFFIISHFDEDHYVGAPGVLKGVRADAEKARGVAAQKDIQAADLERRANESTVEAEKLRLLADASRLKEEAKQLRASVAWVDTMIIYDRKSQYDNQPKWDLPPEETFKTGSGTRPNTWLNYKRAREPFETPKESGGTQTPLLVVGKNILESYFLTHVEMVCIATNGTIGKLNDNRTLGIDEQVKASKAVQGAPRNENDLSFAFLLRFGSFRYYTGGDLCGVEDTESGVEKYTNMETPLATWVEDRWKDKYGNADFHVCAAKVNHHGSNSSTNEKFRQVFNPRLAVISAGNRNFAQRGENRKILPDTNLIETLLGKKFPIPANDKPVRPVFFTYRFGRPLDPTVEDYKNWLKADKRYTEPKAQDIILLVKKEADMSPLVNGKPPQIRIFLRKRDRSSLLPNKTAKPFAIKDGEGPDKNIYVCDRKELHNAVVFPAFGPAAPSSSR
jgi:hypothetical protein